MSLTAPFAAPAGAHVVVRDLSKEFVHGGRTLSVLRGVNFELRPGEIASVVGASGAGKSTLLHVLGTIDLPTAGSIHFDGADVTRLGAASATGRSGSSSSSTTSCPSSPRSRT
jgi:ABC-type lipoprotein export system ATPase subunit